MSRIDRCDGLTMSETAKLLAVGDDCPTFGRNKLFSLLRIIGWLNKDNEPYQQYVDKGYFKLILKPSIRKIHSQTVVLPKGVKAIKDVLDQLRSGGSCTL